MAATARVLLLSALILLTHAGAEAGEGDADVMNLLFIHHSCGGQLFAEPGPAQGGDRASGEQCIYVSHPNGGGLRSRLEAGGYQVHEASYGSLIGQDTDLCHWRAKFTGQMDRILRTQRQDQLLPEGQTNEIVCFKSCFPNNLFVAAGDEPGDPDSCERTVANAKAAYQALLPAFRAQPEVLFVAFSAPPMAEYKPVGLKATIKSWFGKNDRGGAHALAFNAWLVDREQGWLAEYDLPNVVVFDYYDVLRAGNQGGYSSFTNGHDSHPSSEGNHLAADAFVPFLAAAVSGMNQVHP